MNMCPLNRNCLQSSIIYQTTVTRKDNSTTETYIGLTGNDLKTNTETTLHHSDTQNTETLLNSAKTYLNP